MKAVFFKYHPNIRKKDLRDSADNVCGLVDPDFRSNKMPIWSVCGPYIRKKLEIGDVVFFLPVKSKAKKVGIGNSYSAFTGVLVVDKILKNLKELQQEKEISRNYKLKYRTSLFKHLALDPSRTIKIRPQKIIVGNKVKSVWLWPKKKISVDNVACILDKGAFLKRRIPYLYDKRKIKKLYRQITGKKL